MPRPSLNTRLVYQQHSKIPVFVNSISSNLFSKPYKPLNLFVNLIRYFFNKTLICFNLKAIVSKGQKVLHTILIRRSSNRPLSRLTQIRLSLRL